MKKKTKFIILGIIAFIFLAIIISYISLVSSKTIIAQIDVEQGDVFVNNVLISESAKLSQGDVIRTSSTGLATVILYESIVINLDENTEISLDSLAKSNPTVSHKSGSFFSQVTNLLGITSYTVKSGNSVASVRGTSFSIEQDKIFVGNGKVEYEIDGQRFEVVQGRAVEKKQGEIIERELTPEEKERIRKLKLRAIEGLKRLREKELEKKSTLVNMIKKQQGLTDKDIKEGFESLDKGQEDLEEIKEMSPVNLKSLDKIVDITEQIRKLNSEL